jgi:serine/threonine protein kinase
VLDFGLAKALAGAPLTSPATLTNSPTITSPVGVTGVGTLLGTAAYMSPEQAIGKGADRRSDTWAFGVVLFEMLTGRALFAGETLSHVLAAVLKDEPDWTRLPVHTPPAVRRLLRRCLNKDRKQRLDSATAARLEIVDAFTSPPLIAASSRRERVAWLLASTALIVAVGSLAGLLWTGRRLPPTRNVRPVRFDVITPSSDPRSIALSPDGELLAFVAAVDGAARLWIRPLHETTAHPLIGTDGASFPFWSPDAQSIGFFADGQLKRIDVAGGTAQVLARAQRPRWDVEP